VELGRERSRFQRLVWLGDSLETLRTFPKLVQNEIGFALYQAQLGYKHATAKPLKGFGPGVLEVVSDYHGDTFRAVFTVRFHTTTYVLHVFQKKSKHGIATPRRDVELVRQRLKLAQTMSKVQEER
jgi:phage-related protein